MAGARLYEHAEVRVRDLSAAVDFYVNVLGCVELARDGTAAYIGAGLDENFDLALQEGGTGCHSLSLRVDDQAELDVYERRWRELGLPVQRCREREPGERDAVRVQLPDGPWVELVDVADRRVHERFRPARTERSAIAPLDGDHVNIVATDVAATQGWLVRLLDLRLSDAVCPAGGRWYGAWLRRGSHHHDVAVTHTAHAGQTLGHIAWAYDSIEHMKLALDMLATHGVRLELGLSRHPVGANLYAYVLDPGGNRTELCAEMATLDAACEPRYWSSPEDSLDAWGAPRLPDSFFEGS